MAGHGRPKDGVASLADDPAFHEACRGRQACSPNLWNVMMDRRVKPGDDEL
jgi:hypothetical protein